MQDSLASSSGAEQAGARATSAAQGAGTTITVHDTITADELQALVDDSPPGTTISLAPGTYRFDQTIVIDRDDIAVVGAGSDKTIIEVPPDLNAEAFRVGQGSMSGDWTLAQPVADGGTKLVMDGPHTLQPGDYVYLSRESTEAFYDEIGDTEWRNTDVALRTSIVRVKSVDGNVVTLESGVHFDFDTTETTVREIDLAEDVTLGGFAVDYGLGEADPADFSNTLPGYDRDAVIQVSGTAGLDLFDVAAHDIPSMGVNVGLSRDARVDGITMTGAHNKGDGGNGYALQIRDAYDSSFTNLTDQDMRHSVVFASWRSSAGNEVHVLSTDRDINFHGARHHDNTVWVDQSLRDAESDVIGATLFYNTTGTHYGAPVDPTTNVATFGEVVGTRLNDTIRGYDDGAWLDGAGGNDILTGGAGNDWLRGGAGRDTLAGGAGSDVAAFAGDVADFKVTLNADGTLTVQDKTGAEGTDTVSGTEWLAFDDGAIRLSDMAVLALSALDGVFAGPGTHDLGPQPKAISDGGRAATLQGTGGDDSFAVSNGNTAVRAGGGFDTVRSSVSFTAGADVEKLELVGGLAVDGTGCIANDMISGNEAANRVRGFEGVDQLWGNGGDDRLYGHEGNDALDGGNGADSLNAGAGDDALVGGAGDDRLLGASGRDTLTGGTGADVFLFGWTGSSRPGTPDRITDFRSGEDTIDLSGIDANAKVAGEQAFVWGSGGAGRLWLSGGLLSGDVNGDGRADIQIDVGSAWVGRGDVLL